LSLVQPERQVWIGQCPGCGKPGLVLGMKPSETSPATLYCPECQRECMLFEVKFVRLR